MSVNKSNIQDLILNQIRKQHAEITIFLVNGVPLKGHISGFDNFTIMIENGEKQNLVYKHAVSSIVFPKSIELDESEAEAEVEIVAATTATKE